MLLTQTQRQANVESPDRGLLQCENLNIPFLAFECAFGYDWVNRSCTYKRQCRR